ncbi:mitochondrial import receptor subunit TOM7 homolog [Mixophyes fleayi]|uniref:mitochondrial import receptor subunit TOM7 homolog n=1 Tax=Mixophyes fleayi TaxID=3061075 RepID=UPI003F4DB0BB
MCDRTEPSKQFKQRLQKVFKCRQFTVRWGFTPLILYLGFKRGADPGMPEPTILRPSISQRKPEDRGLFIGGP